MKCIYPQEPEVALLCEVRIVLVRARSAKQARRRAEVLGREHEHEYENANGVLVQWRFDGVLDVQMLADDDLQDGAEVYSEFMDEYEVERLRDAR